MPWVSQKSLDSILVNVGGAVALLGQDIRHLVARVGDLEQRVKQMTLQADIHLDALVAAIAAAKTSTDKLIASSTKQADAFKALALELTEAIAASNVGDPAAIIAVRDQMDAIASGLTDEAHAADVAAAAVADAAATPIPPLPTASGASTPAVGGGGTEPTQAPATDAPAGGSSAPPGGS